MITGVDILSRIRSWFGKQEQLELSSDVEREQRLEPTSGGGEHQEHLMDRVEDIDRQIADEQGL